MRPFDAGRLSVGSHGLLHPAHDLQQLGVLCVRPHAPRGAPNHRRTGGVLVGGRAHESGAENADPALVALAVGLGRVGTGAVYEEVAVIQGLGHLHPIGGALAVQQRHGEFDEDVVFSRQPLSHGRCAPGRQLRRGIVKEHLGLIEIARHDGDHWDVRWGHRLDRGKSGRGVGEHGRRRAAGGLRVDRRVSLAHGEPALSAGARSGHQVAVTAAGCVCVDGVGDPGPVDGVGAVESAGDHAGEELFIGFVPEQRGWGGWHGGWRGGGWKGGGRE